MNKEISTEQQVTLIFKYADGREVQTLATPGQSVLDVAHKHDVHIIGACGGVCACATCHVIVEDKWFNALPPATDREEAMLDNAQELDVCSRLCCQIKVDQSMNGMIISIPSSTEGEGHDH